MKSAPPVITCSTDVSWTFWTTEQARFQKDVLDKEGKAALADLRSKLNAAAAEEARLNARLDALYDQSTVGEQVLSSCVCVMSLEALQIFLYGSAAHCGCVASRPTPSFEKCAICCGSSSPMPSSRFGYGNYGALATSTSAGVHPACSWWSACLARCRNWKSTASPAMFVYPQRKTSMTRHCGRCESETRRCGHLEPVPTPGVVRCHVLCDVVPLGMRLLVPATAVTITAAVQRIEGRP